MALKIPTYISYQDEQAHSAQQIANEGISSPRHGNNDIQALWLGAVQQSRCPKIELI
jgi:hypothetical protein